MFMTPWIEEEDGSYHESVVSFVEGSQPIARLRCVKTIDGFYEAIIRDAGTTGSVIAANVKKCTLDYAKYRCVAQLSFLSILTEPRYE